MPVSDTKWKQFSLFYNVLLIGKPCKNNGTCKDGINSYSCQCANGYDGSDCENNIDECLTAMCYNNATCVDGIANYMCNCSLGYKGKAFKK